MNGWLLDDLEPATIAQAIRVSALEKDSLSWETVPEFSISELGDRLEEVDSKIDRIFGGPLD